MFKVGLSAFLAQFNLIFIALFMVIFCISDSDLFLRSRCQWKILSRRRSILELLYSIRARQENQHRSLQAN